MEIFRMKWTLEEAQKQLPSIINATSKEPQLIDLLRKYNKKVRSRQSFY
jgi:hypothetical protein